MIRQFVTKRQLNLFTEFSNSIKRQIAENKELLNNMKQLSDQTTRIGESDAMQRAKSVMEQGSKTTGQIASNVYKAAESVHSAVGKTMEMPVVKKTIETASMVAETTIKVAEKVAEPIMDTSAVKGIKSGMKIIQKEIIDTSTSARYSEYKPKHLRVAEKAEKEKEMLKSPHLKLGPISANTQAQDLVIHKTSKWNQNWEAFKEKNLLSQGISKVKENIEQSENPFIERVRDFFSRMSQETEYAQAVRLFRQVDPSFTVDKFVKSATEEYLPEIVEAYLSGDTETLKTWCSEQLCAQFGAGIATQRTQGLISSCKLLDLRKVDLAKISVIDNDIPILIVDFYTQETILFKNAKGEIVLGREDHIEHVRYRASFTKDQCIDPTTPIHPITMGYKCQDCVRLDSWAGF